MTEGESSEPARGLQGLTVVAFESRRGAEMAELIRRHGGEPLLAPAMREVPLGDATAVGAFLTRLAAGEIDVLILMTGTGVRMLVETAPADWPPPRCAAALRRARLVARGPKPVAALRVLGLRADAIVPEPNTWHELLAVLDAQLPVAGKRVAVQEYGASNPELLAALTARRARVEPVAVYRWALPDDLAPLRGAVAAITAGTAGVVLFTSATQVHHLFQVAGTEGDRLRDALARLVVGSIGPVCSEALRAHRLAPDVEPEHPKMGQLVGAVARRARDLLAAKRAS